MEAACGVPALPPPPPGRHLPRRRPSAPRVHRAWTDQRTHWCTPRAGEALVVRLDRGSSNLRGACESPQTRGSCPWKRWRSAQASTSVATQTTSATSAHGDQHPGEHPRRPVGAGPRRWSALTRVNLAQNVSRDGTSDAATSTSRGTAARNSGASKPGARRTTEPTSAVRSRPCRSSASASRWRGRP
jgi:hypothetical protein